MAVRLKRLTAELFLVSDGRPLLRVAVWLPILMLFAGIRGGSELADPGPFTADGHAIASLNGAMNEVFCGRYAVISNTYQIGFAVARTPDLFGRPLRSIVTTQAGGIDAYCSTLRVPFGNNENALSEIMHWILRVSPNASARRVNQALWLVRLSFLCAFALGVFAAGGSALLAAGAFEIGLALLRSMRDLTSTVYPFLFLMPLVVVACLTMAVRQRSRGRAWFVVWLAIAGAVAALGVNLRTSHLPVYVAAALFVFVMSSRSLGIPIRQTLAGALALSVAFVSANYWIVAKRVPAANDYNYSYHAVAHPLVLALGLPQSDLSRREGIQWLDEVGGRLARRYDPSAVYLGQRYERALLGYYASLWRQFPVEMVDIYARKFALAGDGLVRALSAEHGALELVRPWSILSDGYLRGWALLTILFVSSAAYRQRCRPFLALVAGITLVALLLHVESSLIIPAFMLRYHAYAGFYAAFLSLLCVQYAVNALARLPASSPSMPTSPTTVRGEVFPC